MHAARPATRRLSPMSGTAASVVSTPTATIVAR